MVNISVRREPARKAYASRRSFYADGPTRGEGPPFCKVLELGSPNLHRFRDAGRGSTWRGVPWVTLVVGSGCLELPDDPALDPERLGAEVARVIADLVDSEQGERFETFGDSLIGRGVVETSHASAFARALIHDRLQLASRPRGAGAAPPPSPARQATDEVSALAARFGLLASQLTRLYYESMARAEQPLSRWEAPAAVLKQRHSADLRPYIELCQWHCSQAIIDLQRGIRPERLTDEMAEAIMDLLADVQTGVGDPGSVPAQTSITLMHLRQVTELAWYLMTIGRGAYPGWAELLFGLLLQEKPGALDRSRPRPSRLRREQQSDPIGMLLGPASEQSWASRAELARSPRTDFYDAVAEVLWEQSRVVSDDTGGVRPPASAFVTSFDVEVEMAMWAAAKEGDSFYVVVPVHVFQGQADNVARPCWLRGEIRRTANPHPSLAELCRPCSWEVLAATEDPRRLQTGPHVIHLSGAPLITLPGADAPWFDPHPPEQEEEILADIWSGLTGLGVAIQQHGRDDQGRRDPTKDMLLEHAVTTDEYLAVRQAEAELLLTSMEDKDKDVRKNRSLPAYLTAANAEGEPGKGDNPRFWMVVGVPISDPAIRHRLVSQLSPKRPPRDTVDVVLGEDLLGLGDDQGPGEARTAAGLHVDLLGLETEAPTGEDASDEVLDPTRVLSGIVVNRRLSDDQGHLLYWMGFDVVRDTAASFTPDLLHYAAHLREDGWRAWPFEQGSCPVDLGGR